jgi:hypothetical protein
MVYHPRQGSGIDPGKEVGMNSITGTGPGDGRPKTGGMGRRFMRAGSRVTLLGLLVISILGGPAFAQQDPCAEQGPDCRLLTSAEVGALKARLLALRAAMPVPDPERWAPPPDVGEAYTMSFLAELNAGGTMTCGSWPAGAFT